MNILENQILLCINYEKLQFNNRLHLVEYRILIQI